MASIIHQPIIIPLLQIANDDGIAELPHV